MKPWIIGRWNRIKHAARVVFGRTRWQEYRISVVDTGFVIARIADDSPTWFTRDELESRGVVIAVGATFWWGSFYPPCQDRKQRAAALKLVTQGG